MACQDQPRRRSAAVPETAAAERRALIVLDWDDTLLPSTFIAQYGLLHMGELSYLPPNVQRMLYDIQQAVFKLLDLATKLGDVVIITNSQHGWVEHSCKAFFPMLLDYLEKNVPIVSARTTYEHLHPENPLCWKAACFANQVKSFNATHGRFPDVLVSVGDSFDERAAAHILANHMMQITIRTVQLIGCPTPRQIVAQLQEVTSSLERIVTGSENSFDITAYALENGSVQFAPAAMLTQSCTMTMRPTTARTTTYHAVIEMARSLEREQPSESTETEAKLSDPAEPERTEQDMVRCTG